MSNKDIFMHVPQLGDLYIYDVLFAFIYPRAFVCQSEYDCKYLFYEMDSEDDKDIWLVSKITKKEYYSLVDRKKPIQKAYENKNNFELFSILKDYSNDNRIELVQDGKEWLSHLPQIPVFAEKEVNDDIANETLAVARETGNTTFDIRLFPGTDRHSVPQNILSDLCSAFTSLTSSVFGTKRSEALRVATASGSCVVRFSFPDQINLFNESNAINEMAVLNNVLSSESIYEGLNVVKDQKRFIRSYADFLNAIRKTYSDVQFSTASPNSNEVRKIKLTSDTIKNRFNDVKGIYSIEKEEIDISGKLIALDIITKRFKLQTGENIMSGNVELNDLNNGKFEIPMNYNAKIQVEKYMDEKGKKSNSAE